MDISVRSRGFGVLQSSNTAAVSPGAGSFLSGMKTEHVKKADASAQVSAAEDENLAVGSYEQRLDRLRKLHAGTDYSGMEPRDRNKLIIDRFRSAFPDYTAILGGLYSMLGENSVYGEIRDEATKQVMDACPGFAFPMKGEERNAYQRYVWGYDGMSEDEIRAVVLQKNNGGTLADIIAASQELSNLGIDVEATGLLSTQLDMEMRKGTEAAYGHLHTDNPVRIEAMIAYAKGGKISWQSLSRNLLTEVSTHTFKRADMSSEEAKRIALAEMESCLLDFLGKVDRAENRQPEACSDWASAIYKVAM